jgi:hypothetical protein
MRLMARRMVLMRMCVSCERRKLEHVLTRADALCLGSAGAHHALADGMQPEVIELGWDLSPTPAQEFDKLVEAVAAELVSCEILVTLVQQAPEEARYA